MGKMLDLRGLRFGLLTVLGRSDTVRLPGGSSQRMWRCVCDCGPEPRDCPTHNLMSGNSKSCGCVRKPAPTTTHGEGGYGEGKRTLEYNSWGSMKSRCNDANNPAYSRYGGRGITVCDRWRNSYEDFLADMGRRPTPQHSLDRINNNGNYEPGNCRWATQSEQCRNTRYNAIITAHGKSLCVTEWAEITGVKRHTLYKNVMNGLKGEDALSIQARRY